MRSSRRMGSCRPAPGMDFPRKQSCQGILIVQSGRTVGQRINRRVVRHVHRLCFSTLSRSGCIRWPGQPFCGVASAVAEVADEVRIARKVAKSAIPTCRFWRNAPSMADRIGDRRAVGAAPCPGDVERRRFKVDCDVRGPPRGGGTTPLRLCPPPDRWRSQTYFVAGRKSLMPT